MLRLITYPDPRLDTPCVEVGKDEIHDLVETISDAINIMMKEDGIGLAANQVGLDKRFIIVMIGRTGIVPMINPVITYSSDVSTVQEEGCLSFPGQTSKVRRSTYIEVDYLDMKGEEQTMALSHMNARIVLHEFEHLEGKNFLR